MLHRMELQFTRCMTQPAQLGCENLGCGWRSGRRRSARSGGSFDILAAFCEIQAFDRRTLFVVVPGLDQYKGEGMRRVKIAIVEVKSVLESLAAAGRHVTIQAPFRRGIIETRPRGADSDLVWMLVAHVLVEIVQIPLAPITSVWRPSLLSGLNPGIRSRNSAR